MSYVELLMRAGPTRQSALYLEEGDALGGWGYEQIAALGEALRQLADKSVSENAAKGTKPFLWCSTTSSSCLATSASCESASARRLTLPDPLLAA